MNWNIKIKKKVIDTVDAVKESVKKNFRFATCDCLFILLFISIFGKIFGAANNIVGVILTVLMGASLQRDLTNAPVKHFFIMTFVMICMTVAACYVSCLNPYIALPVNLIVTFFILYCYTYEYASNLYFPYVLSYLFMIFITPIQPADLPLRLVGVAVGCTAVFIYHVIMGRNTLRNTIKSSLNEIIDTATEQIRQIMCNEPAIDNEIENRKRVCKLSRLVDERRKRALHISDASFAAIDTARGLENLTLLLKNVTAENDANLLNEISLTLESFKVFLSGKTTSIAPIAGDAYGYNDTALEIYNVMEYIRVHLLRMCEKNKRNKYRKTVLSYSVRIKSALRLSSVRFVYAIRVAVLISVFTMAVQLLKLPHGKWLLFTIASVSLPCADDVGNKAYKRLFATILGGLISFVLFSCISNTTLRTVIMTLSGYFSFYFADYKLNYACATIGALGGAIFATSFGAAEVGMIVGIRLGYIVTGILIALIANRLLFPLKRRTINEQLWKKYSEATLLLTTICTFEHVDTQLYYDLVIQSHMMEETLMENAEKENKQELFDILNICRARVRAAHRNNAFNTTSLETQT